VSGKLAQKRQHADARRAARLQAEGRTAREIAAAIGKKPEQVKGLVLLGQRLIDAEAAG
jgi:hypothetical protein